MGPNLIKQTGLATAVVAVVLTAGAAAQTEGPLAAVRYGEDAIAWKPVVEYKSLTLTLSGPVSLERSFRPGDRVELSLKTEQGPLPDGSYSWELRGQPAVDPALQRKMTEARAAGDQKMMDGLYREGYPSALPSQTGAFTVAKGRIVNAGVEEAVPRAAPRGTVFEGDLEIGGNLKVAGTKSFVALDPDGNRRLVYAALEGPEAGTYYRGSARTVDGEAVIELPDHFAAASEPDGLTVQLTPLGGWARLFVAEKSTRRLVVRDAAGGDGVAFDFLVQGVRRGYSDYRPEEPLPE